MIAVDTNILVYAHRADSPFFERAQAAIRGLAEGKAPWAIPWPCLHEFLAITTNPRIFRIPTPTALALEQIDAWQRSPVLTLLTEDDGYWPCFSAVVASGHIQGGKIHDARIAALCTLHKVSELWTADRDFSRFPMLKTRNPV